MIIVELPREYIGWTRLSKSGFPIGAIWGKVASVTALGGRWLIAIDIRNGDQNNPTRCLFIDADKVIVAPKGG